MVVRNELDYKLLLGFPMPSALPEHVRAVPFKGEIIGTPTTMIVLIEGCRSNNAAVIEQRRIDFVNALGRGMLPHLRAAGGAQWPRSSWPQRHYRHEPGIRHISMISSFSNEPALRDELTKIDSRQAEIEAELDRVRALKQILYLKDKPLETEVVRFLSEELSIPARHAGGTDEDFWLVDSDDGDWAIGEVKASASGSVDRQQIGKLDGHRKEAGRPDDFPALLVANTVHKRQTIEGRDEPIAPDIVKRATTDHVLVVRTLDLSA